MGTVIVLFHPVYGLTEGVVRFAARLEEKLDPEKGFTLMTPDLFDGKTFTDEAQAQAYVQEKGFPTFLEKAREYLPSEGDLVLAGFSLGGAVAQTLGVQLAEKASALRIRACLLFHAALSPQQLGITRWPDVHLQIHFAFGDPWKKSEAIGALETLVDASKGLFHYWAYPIKGHLFSLEGFDNYKEEHSEKLLDNAAEFLNEYCG